MTTGKIIKYDEEDGGYIQPDDGGDKLPFTRSDLTAATQEQTLHEGDRVTFDVEGGLAGVGAKNISLIEETV